jgi:hypothetical protein
MPPSTQPLPRPLERLEIIMKGLSSRSAGISSQRLSWRLWIVKNPLLDSTSFNVLSHSLKGESSSFFSSRGGSFLLFLGIRGRRCCEHRQGEPDGGESGHAGCGEPETSDRHGTFLLQGDPPGGVEHAREGVQSTRLLMRWFHNPRDE